MLIGKVRFKTDKNEFFEKLLFFLILPLAHEKLLCFTPLYSLFYISFPIAAPFPFTAPRQSKDTQVIYHENMPKSVTPTFTHKQNVKTTIHKSMQTKQLRGVKGNCEE